MCPKTGKGTSDVFGRLWTSSGIFGNDHFILKNPRIKSALLYFRKRWKLYLVIHSTRKGGFQISPVISFWLTTLKALTLDLLKLSNLRGTKHAFLTLKGTMNTPVLFVWYLHVVPPDLDEEECWFSSGANWYYF